MLAVSLHTPRHIWIRQLISINENHLTTADVDCFPAAHEQREAARRERVYQNEQISK
jgi:hypothetical protein